MLIALASLSTALLLSCVVLLALIYQELRHRSPEAVLGTVQEPTATPHKAAQEYVPMPALGLATVLKGGAVWQNVAVGSHDFYGALDAPDLVIMLRDGRQITTREEWMEASHERS